MSSSVSNATTTTRTISMYSHISHEFGFFGKKENTLNEEINCYFKRSNSCRLDVSAKLFPKESIYSCDSFERRGGTLDTEREESDSLKSSSTSLPVTRSISRCRDGYWITTDPDFVVLDLSWDDS